MDMRHFFLFSLLGACASVDVEDGPFVEPMCGVIRRADGSGVVTDRFVFSELGLVSHVWQWSPGTRGLRINTYENWRIVHGEVETWHRANESQTYGPWQMRMALYDADTYFHHDLTFTYDENGQLSTWKTDALTSFANTEHTSSRTVVYRHNAEGQKIREDQYSGAATAPWLSNTYTYRNGRLDNIHTVQDGRPRDLWLVYDDHGNLIRRRADDFLGLRYDFDGQGHLVGWNGQHSYTRDDQGLIIASTVGTPVTFEYVEGRLVRATYEDGSGYTQTYGSGCPTGFSHPLVTPNSLYIEHYEGPPMHHTWSSY